MGHVVAFVPLSLGECLSLRCPTTLPTIHFAELPLDSVPSINSANQQRGEKRYLLWVERRYWLVPRPNHATVNRRVLQETHVHGGVMWEDTTSQRKCEILVWIKGDITMSQEKKKSTRTLRLRHTVIAFQNVIGA